MLAVRQISMSRPVTILSGFDFTLSTPSSFSTTLTNSIVAESSQPDGPNNDSALNHAAHAFFRNKGAMAGLFTAAGLLLVAALALCLAYRRRAIRRTQHSVEEHVSVSSLGEKHEAVGYLQERTGTTFRLGPGIQSYRDHPFASPELSISGRSTPSIVVHHRTELSATKRQSQPLSLPLSPSLEEFVALGASRYHLSANLYLPNHPQPPLLLSEEARHRIRTGERGKGLAMEEMTSPDSRFSRQTLSKQTSTKSSQGNSRSSKHRSTVTSTTSSMREEREWWWNRRRIRTTRLIDEWAMFRSPLETSSTERCTREKVDSIELGGIQLVKRDGAGADSFGEELTGKRPLPVLPLLPFQESIDSKAQGEGRGPSVDLSRTLREEETGSRKKLLEPSSRKKLSKASRKTKDRDVRGSEAAVFTLADALTHSRRPTELDEYNASGGRVRSPFTSSSMRLGRSDPSPRVDLHPYAY